MTSDAAISAVPPEAVDLLGEVSTPLAGLYRRHPQRNLAAIGDAILASYRNEGPVRLGSRRSLVVIAVDGLGYSHARANLTTANLSPIISEFPTTTVACLMTSVTREPAFSHGFIGVQYLHPDGDRLVNCHDGSTTEAAEIAETAPGRRTPTPTFQTIFDVLADTGVPAMALPNELAGLHADARDRLLHGARIAGTALPATKDPVDLVAAFADELTAATAARPDTLIWTYLDLDSHIHRHGFDRQAALAMTALDELARRLHDAGTSVLVFSDHGLARSGPSQATRAAWAEATSARWCRLPPGGAGRIRWLYPQPSQADRLTDFAAGKFPDAVVVTSDQLAELGFVAADSIGQRRLGEIVLIATGADFPVPDPEVAYEHGSMTAEEVVVPMAIWPAVQ
ncbi:MAG TPA: alkaline phosphatase family protein [Streptosporangiaceae bacterium]|nr:alkaline phosphatase family protein [Streptosporangiaceae bacterium]